MSKPVPDPPYEPTPLEQTIRADDLAKNREAIKRALDFYLCPQPGKAHSPSTMFLIQPEIDTETLLARPVNRSLQPTLWPVISLISWGDRSAIRRWRFSRSSCSLSWR